MIINNTFYLAQAYGEGNYNQNNYSSQTQTDDTDNTDTSTQSPSTTTTTNAPPVDTPQSSSVLANTGVYIIAIVTIACVLIFAGLVIRFVRKPSKLKSQKDNNISPSNE